MHATSRPLAGCPDDKRGTISSGDAAGAAYVLVMLPEAFT